MEVLIRQDAEAVGHAVADRIEAEVRRANGAPLTLGLATGSSPVTAYTELIRRHREESLSFAGVTVFMLDEYVGLPAEHPQSYHRFIRENFTDHVDIDDARVFSPRGDAPDAAAEARRYDEAIREAGGVDLQVLGIGATGHIGFNEPGSSLVSRTRVKTLVQKTVQDNARFFDSADEVPIHVLTQGVGTILDARAIVLAASGENKAEAIHQMVEGPISARWTGTALQQHANVLAVVDEAAASKLELADYFRFVEANRADVPGAQATA